MKLDGLPKLTESAGKVLVIAGRIQVSGFESTFPGEKKTLIKQFQDDASELIASLAFIFENQDVNICELLNSAEEKLQVFRDEDEDMRRSKNGKSEC